MNFLIRQSFYPLGSFIEYLSINVEATGHMMLHKYPWYTEQVIKSLLFSEINDVSEVFCAVGNHVRYTSYRLGRSGRLWK